MIELILQIQTFRTGSIGISVHGSNEGGGADCSGDEQQPAKRAKPSVAVQAVGGSEAARKSTKLSKKIGIPVEEKIIVADMMAGVGPFAVPLAQSGKCTVHANDLNPASYKYLLANAKANHCAQSLCAYNMDGRDFILKLQVRTFYCKPIFS